ncbi:MAG: 3-deoxy-7-phosphoheptulonate synthase, partial [Erysipelotrichaceae bacterium]|nr:3-deoxy-7-phosphoheptulonate synthase [Erysipelotrichaceae bacterium]
MIITLKRTAPAEAVENIIRSFESRNLTVHRSYGENYIVLGLVGDTTQLDERSILANEWIENVQRVAAPY